jgi:hypothetical protein
VDLGRIKPSERTALPLPLLASLQADSGGGRPLVVVVHNASHGSALEANARADAEAPPAERPFLPTRHSGPYARKCKH